MRINFEILDLRAFLAVLDLGSFHKAAEALNMAQPTVSRRVQSLETALGATLLERSTRRVALTRAGRELDPMFRNLLRDLENCAFQIGSYGAKQSGVVTVASVPTAASAFLPRALKVFQQQYPGIGFHILDLSAKEGLESVSRGEAEFSINFLGASRPDLKFTPLLDDYFAVACRVDHPFASRPSLQWSDLVGHPLIVSQNSGNRAVIDQALAKTELRLDWSYEVLHLSTSFGLVEAGVGMSVLPSLSRPAGKHPIIAVVPLKAPIVKRTIGIVERRTVQLSRAAAKFREVVLQIATKDLKGRVRKR